MEIARVTTNGKRVLILIANRLEQELGRDFSLPMEPLNVSVFRGFQDLNTQNRIVKAGPFAKTVPGGSVARCIQVMRLRRLSFNRNLGCGLDRRQVNSI